MITRRKGKNGKLYGLLPDPISKRQDALQKVKAICAYTISNSKIRKELLKRAYKDRISACNNKRGDIYVCGYVRKKDDKVVKGYCRKFPKKHK